MSFQSRRPRLQLVALATAALTLTPIATGFAAETRKVSVESMVYDLKSPDAVRRQTAVRDLGVVKHKGAIPDLVAMVHDPVDAVRRELELTLERMDDMQTLPGFIAMAADAQNDIRSRATAALVNLHLPRTTGFNATISRITEMIRLAPDSDNELKIEPDVAVDPAVIETLRTRVTDSERGIRRTAIRGLGILCARPGVPDLLQVVREDRDDSLRLDGVRALRKIADGSIAGELVALLNINTDAVRYELMATLGAMRFRGAVPELTRIVDQAKKTDASQILALAALADIADPASVPTFERLKGDKHEALRLYANEGIARTANANQKSEISAARLVEKSPRVRAAQAFALLRIGEPEYLDELVRALERTTTRELAKEYLIETRSANREALFAPRTTSSAVRAELADVMGLIGDPMALPRLQEMAHDSDGDVARAAERATRRLAVATSSQDR